MNDLKSLTAPSVIPTLYHVYTIDDELISNLPALLLSDPLLKPILFGFTPKHVSMSMDGIKSGEFDGFVGLKPAEINKFLQSQITRAQIDMIPIIGEKAAE